jgi:hypothetical protein
VFAVNPETDADSPSLVVTPVNGENEPVVFRNISTVDNDPVQYRLTSAELVYVPPNVNFGK